MTILKKYLVVRADGEARVVSRYRLRPDEVAFPLNIDMPAAWGLLQRESPIDIKMPPPPTVQQA